MEWRPISKAQERFLALPDTLREAMFGGSAGPGKSECLMMLPIVREFIRYPRFKALFTRRTYGELKAEIIPRSRELYRAFGGEFNKADLLWEFTKASGMNHSKSPQGAGALIFFGHIEHEDSVHKYDSMEINLFLPDEIQTLTEWMYIYIGFSRVRSSSPDLPALIRGAGMPGDIGHSWVKKRFIDPAPRGSKIIHGKAGNKRIFIFSTLADNPKVNQEYATGLEVLPEAEKRAKKYGDWSAYEGQVFEEFRDRHYADEIGEYPNAIHVIPKFDIPDWWPKIYVIDWGFHAMTWVGCGAISPTKRVYIYREMAWKKTKIEDWAPYVKELVERENPRAIKVCKSAGQDRGQEHTIQQQIDDALGRSVELTNNSPGSRVAGKILLHEYLRWKPKYVPVHEQEIYDEEVAMWNLRNYGETGYRNYLMKFQKSVEEDNLPRLQIFEECQLLINAIKACTYEKSGADGVKKEDVAEFDGDDPYDGIRYMLDECDRYFNESTSEFEKLQAHEKIIKEFEANQDYNFLFRKAQALEALDRARVRPIARYKHRSNYA